MRSLFLRSVGPVAVAGLLALLLLLRPGAEPQALGAEVYFPDDRHVMIGMPDSFATYFAKPPAKDGPIAGAIKLAASGKPVVAAANVAALAVTFPALAAVPPEVRPLLKAKTLM